MRILYVDIDTLRPDHLGCYGYPRATSTNIDKVPKILCALPMYIVPMLPACLAAPL